MNSPTTTTADASRPDRAARAPTQPASTTRPEGVRRFSAKLALQRAFVAAPSD